MTWEEFCKGMHEEPPEEWHGAFERLSHKEVIALTFAARIAQTEVSLKAFADELVKRTTVPSNVVKAILTLLHEAGVPQ